MVTLEQPALQNAETVWRFRNDVATRRELGWRPISYGDCLAWIADCVSGKIDQILFLVRDDKIGDVGFVMFDDDTLTGVRQIRVSIGPAFRGKGYGQQAIKLATTIGETELPQTVNRRLIANVRAENYKAVFAFESAGYVEVQSFVGPDKIEYLEFEYKQT